MLRPLLLEFPEDPLAARVDDTYMLGPALLVAPIFSDARQPVERVVYLPTGEWFDFWTDERVHGGQAITRTADLNTLPLYVRAGSILPLAPERMFIGDDLPEMLTLEVYPGAENNASVVWDATGTATKLNLSQQASGWRLDVTGERELSWQVRWHTPGGIQEAVPVQGSRATFVCQESAQ
jgi:alpha-glucosidase (family GH31 glycosyl hydrolase)